MPITYITMLIGTLALIGFPFFSGFYSKDLIIEAVELSTLPGAQLAYWAVLSSVFVTAFYSFRLFFVVFHGKPRMTEEQYGHVHETPMVVWGPLVLLAIPSVGIGAFAMPYLFNGYLSDAIVVHSEHDVLATLGLHFHGVVAMAKDSIHHMPFKLAMAGMFTAFYCYCIHTSLPAKIAKTFSLFDKLFRYKYGFDFVITALLLPLVRGIAWILWRLGDVFAIDGLVNGTASVVRKMALTFRHMQTGYIHHYAFAMMLGIVAFLLGLVFYV